MAAGLSWKASLYETSAKVPRRKKLRHPERRRAEDVSGWKDSVEPESKDLRGLDAEVHDGTGKQHFCRDLLLDY
jgi:hypothetical protein